MSDTRSEMGRSVKRTISGGGRHTAAAVALTGAALMSWTGPAARAQTGTIPSVIPFAYASSQFSDANGTYNVLGAYNFYNASLTKIPITNISTSVTNGSITNPTTTLFAPGTTQYGTLRVSDVGNIDGIAYNPNGLLYTVNDTVPTSDTPGSSIVFAADLRGSTTTYSEQFKIGGLTAVAGANAVTDSIAFLRNTAGVPLYALVDSTTGAGGPNSNIASYLYSVDYNNLQQVNGASTANATLIGQLQFNGSSFLTNGTLVATPDNSLYLTQGDIPGGRTGPGGNLFKIDLSSANGTTVNVAQLGSAGFASPVFGMAAPFTHGNTNLMYAVDTAQPNANEYKVDPNAATPIDSTALTAKYNDPASPPPGFGKIFGLSFTDADAPEPSSASLAFPGAVALLGALGARGLLRRRRAAAQAA